MFLLVVSDLTFISNGRLVLSFYVFPIVVLEVRRLLGEVRRLLGGTSVVGGSTSVVGVLASQNESQPSRKNALSSDFLSSIVLAVNSGAL